MKDLPQKLAYDRIPFTRLQRFRLWLREVWWTMKTMPDTHWTRDRIINPGEPGYDDPMNMILVKRDSEGNWPEPTLTHAYTRPIEPAEMKAMLEKELQISKLNQDLPPPNRP